MTGIHGRLDLDDGTIPEVGAEYLRVDGGGGDDDLELRAGVQDALQEPEDEIDVEAALVGLVHHDHAIPAEQGIELHLLKEDAVGHDLDDRGLVRSCPRNASCSRRARASACRAAGI